MSGTTNAVRELESMKAEFLANISHELRTPLTPIRGYAELLRSREIPRPQAVKLLESILQSTARLERVIDMLVSFAAIEAGGISLCVEPVNLRLLLKNVAERWARRADAAHPIAKWVGRNMPEVMVDRQLLERSLDELVDNAVKYSPRGGAVALEARLSSTGQDAQVEITVRDHGVGMPEQQLDAVFVDFFQLDGSSTRQVGGLGLGLAFVQRVVRAHDGELQCTSVSGAGSTFSIFLPLMPKQARERNGATPSGARSTWSHAGLSLAAGRTSRREVRAGAPA